VHANDVADNGSGCIADADAAPSTWFLSADTHYERSETDHGQHSGDMPVVYSPDGGWAKASFTTDRFRVSDVVGRAVIVHAEPDNFGNVPVGTEPTQYSGTEQARAVTMATGNAGDRIVCGVIRQGR